MKILYILAVFSFVVLAGAVLAITRHVRKGAAKIANPAADNELSEAIDLRLHDLARPSSGQRAAPPAQQDFSYFNKEAPARPPSDSQEHSKAGANNRP
jgi:hypothetical protein